MFKLKKRIFILAVCATFSETLFAYTGWVTPHRINPPLVSWDWNITNSGSTPGVVECGSQLCAFGPIIRTGLGSSGQMCDSGGVCLVHSELQEGIKTKFVPAGTIYDEAFSLYAQKWGMSGSTDFLMIDMSHPEIAWGKLCVGFAVLPVNTRAVSTLVPGSSCSIVTPPDINCETSMPATIDMGTVRTGYVEIESSVDGLTECSAENSVSVSLLVTPRLAGLPVELSINGNRISETATVIGKGRYIPLKISARLRGNIPEAGVYTGNAVMNISYL